MQKVSGAINPAGGSRGHDVNTGTFKAGPADNVAPNAEESDARPAPFAAYIAHELRNALATQRALLELALADPNADIAAWREVGRDVLAACKQQERVLAACITLSRSDAGPPRTEAVELEAIVAEVLRSTDLQGHTAMVSLERAATTGDAVLIERLLENLLVNAVRHNRAGGWIAITTGTQASRAVVTIENTGIRVPAGELARLFEPFEQIHPAATRAGLGLGLAVVKAVADAHGAGISAHVRPGGGLRVEVAFLGTKSTDDRAALSQVGQAR
jgi:signal transduction histidine kinase